MSSNAKKSKVKPSNIKITNQNINLNDPIQARLFENILTLKKSNLWRRRNKIQPIIESYSHII